MYIAILYIMYIISVSLSIEHCKKREIPHRARTSHAPRHAFHRSLAKAATPKPGHEVMIK